MPDIITVLVLYVVYVRAETGAELTRVPSDNAAVTPNTETNLRFIVSPL